MSAFEPLSASRRKFIHSLADAKNRRAEGLFVAEGAKCVSDILGAFTLRFLVATDRWLTENATAIANLDKSLIFTAKRADMERISSLQSPPEVVAVFDIPDYPLHLDALGKQLVVALDRIQDPGNLGTIIRLCDWLGVTDILASSDTVDVFNPKTIQATMGSIARVRVHYVSLPETIDCLAQSAVPVYGTFLDGENIYTAPLTADGVVVMGNEGRGISPEVSSIISRKLFIPPYPDDAPTAESLNVAIATALTLSEFRRRLR